MPSATRGNSEVSNHVDMVFAGWGKLGFRPDSIDFVVEVSVAVAAEAVLCCGFV